MPDTFKQTFLQWFTGFLTVAMIGVITWAFNQSGTISSLETRLDRKKSDISGLKDKIDELRGDLNEARIRLTKFDEINSILLRADSRMDLHSSRLSSHEAEPHHKQAGIEIVRLSQKIEDHENSLEKFRSEVIRPMKDKLDLGDRYTLQMATTDQGRTLRALDKLESSQEKQEVATDKKIESIYEYIARMENHLNSEVHELRDVNLFIMNTLGIRRFGNSFNPSPHSYTPGSNPQDE